MPHCWEYFTNWNLLFSLIFIEYTRIVHLNVTMSKLIGKEDWPL
jgi:hypothetical protein